MKATDFEYHHPTLVRQRIVGAAFLTFLFQADDIVWWFVKSRPSPHRLERASFIVALQSARDHTCCQANDAGATTSVSFATPLGWARWRRYRDLPSWSSAKQWESYDC